MFSLALSVQILITIVCFASILVVANQKTSSYSNIILITFLCSFVQNACYIMELTAKNVDQGMTAIKGEYLGGSFEVCLITFFMFKYCGHEFNRILKGLLVFESIFVFIGVWTWEYNGMYYTGARFEQSGVIPHMVLSHGWLYYTYATTTVIELIACIFILTVSILKSNQKHMKYNYYVLLAVVFIPLVMFVLSITGVFGGFDCTPLGSGMAIGIFAFAVMRNHVFDVAAAAGELILSELENAVVILNNEKGFEYANLKAMTLFPKLIELTKGTIVTDREILALFDKSRTGNIRINNREYDVISNTVKVNKEVIGTTAILFDVTESKKQIEKMRELMKEAEKANSSKSTFLANVSHEIRTPINVIMGMSEVVLRDHNSKEIEDYIVNIRNSSSTLLNLINDILDFSKIESGKMDIVSDTFDMRAVLTEVVSVYTFRCKQKELDFEYEIDPQLPKELIGDVVRIKQIINNVMSNAVKYTEKGKVMFKLTYKYRSDTDIDLIMAVEDTGIGIKKEDQDKLFEGFVRVDQKKTNSIEGTGLGLNITKQLVELMGGLINFKSEYGKGTVFSVVIPVKTMDETVEIIGEIGGHVSNTEKVFTAGFTAPKARVLVVDDSSTNLMVFRELLKKTEVQVFTAQSGQECLDMVGKESYDLIFLDHKMPGMDGIETFLKMKQISGRLDDTPVIMLTANASSEARSYYLSLDFNDFLPKPITSEQLISMLYKYLPEDLMVEVNE